MIEFLQSPLGLVALLAAAACILFVVGRRIGTRRRSAERLSAAIESRTEADDLRPAPPPLAAGIEGGSKLLGLVVAAAIGAGLWVTTGTDPYLCAAIGSVFGTLAWIGHGFVRQRRALQVQEQLANAIDLQVAALRAGASMLDAIEASVRETRGPLRDVLEEASGRLRLGEDPEVALGDMEDLLPLTTVRLYTQSLLAQWQSGGSLAPTLATVASAVRDRIELTRRVRSQTNEARFSVVGILAVTWFIAGVSWTTAPERFENFVTSSVGGTLCAACVALQTVGLVWMTRLSEVLDR